MKNGLLVCLLACLIALTGCATTARADAASSFCNVLDFGAAADGQIDDTPAIQSAVDQCRTVYLPAGAYRIGEPIKITNDRTDILGDGEATRIVKETLGKGCAIEVRDREGVSIRDMAFQGPGIATLHESPMTEAIAVHVLHSRDITIENNYFSGFNGSGVVRVTGDSAYEEPTRWSENIVIRDNRFEGNLDRLTDRGDVAANAVYLLAGVKHFLIEGNIVEASLQKVGIAAHSNIRYGVIRGNRVLNNGAESGSVHAYGIMVYAFPEAHSRRVTVESNLVSNSANMGIYVKGEQSRHFTVRQNVVDRCDYRSDDVTLPAGSISLNEVSDTTVEGNWITNVTTIGVQVFRTNRANVSVKDNFISGDPGLEANGERGAHFEKSRGIVLRSGSNPLSAVRIEQNVIEGIDDAIAWWVPFKQTGDLSNIVIRKNEIRNALRGIVSLDLVDELTWATGFRISENWFDNCQYGIHVTYLSLSLIAGNTFSDCPTPIWLKNELYVRQDHNHILPTKKGARLP